MSVAFVLQGVSILALGPMKSPDTSAVLLSKFAFNTQFNFSMLFWSSGVDEDAAKIWLLQSEVSLPQKRRSIHGNDVLSSLLGEQVSVVSVVSDALCQIAAAIEARQVFQLLLDLGGELGALLNLVKTPLQDFGGETELFADGVQYRWVGFDHAPDGVVNGLRWLWLWLLLLLPGRIIFRVDSRILRLHLS